ncbi:MAG TPA: hypothetical protein VG965_03520 [Patescibacteria group bacterium]|nr:hypothetical protein [Patescibacteria group bacterium]
MPKDDAHSTKATVEKIIDKTIHYNNADDDLVDIHVGNPLHKIVLLLEEIKKQKAFSFTLKGSLGIAGVALAIGLFGVLGGGQILCEKGTQTLTGKIQVLNYMDYEKSDIPFIGDYIDLVTKPAMHNRAVLIRDDETTVRIPYDRHLPDLRQYVYLKTLVTGAYNSCDQTITLSDPASIEVLEN